MKRMVFLAVSLYASSLFSKVYELNQIEVREIKFKKEVVATESSSFEKIDSEELSKLSADSLDDILKLSTGATTTGGPRSSAEAPQIRGLNSQKIFLYIDGARQSFRTDHTSVMAFEPENLKSVEVYKSPGASLKGNSLGGGLILTTKDASDYLNKNEKWGMQYQTAYQSVNQEKKIGAQAFSNNDGLESLFSFTHKEGENIKLSNGETLPNSSYQDNSFLSKFTYNKRAHEKVGLKFEYFQRLDPTPLNPTLNPPENMEELNSENEVTRLSYGGNYQYQNLFFNINQTSQSFNKERLSDGQKELREIQTTGFSLRQNFDIKNSFLAMEVEGNQDELKGSRGEKNLESYPEGKSQNIVLATHFDFKEIKNTTITTGVSYHSYHLESVSQSLEEKNQNHLTKKLGMTYALSPKLELSGLYSEGFNPPRIQDVYADGLHHLGDEFFIADNYFIPNEKLRPESSQMIEVGLKYQSNLFSSLDMIILRGQYYENRVEDYIYLEKIDRAISDGINGTTQFINIPNVEIKGQEIRLEYLYDRYSLNLTYSRIRGENLDDGLWIADLPADQYLVKFEYNLALDYSFGYLGNIVESQKRVNPETTERTDETEGYVTHSVFAKKLITSGPLKNLEVLTRIDNLTNVEYRKHGSNILEAGLDLKLGLTYKVTYF